MAGLLPHTFRLGKVVWSDLPQDVLAGADEPQTAEDFAKFVLEDSTHLRIFNTKLVQFTFSLMYLFPHDVIGHQR